MNSFYFHQWFIFTFYLLKWCYSMQFKGFSHEMKDGWGLATDGNVLYGSDGTSTLYQFHPHTMKGSDIWKSKWNSQLFFLPNNFVSEKCSNHKTYCQVSRARSSKTQWAWVCKRWSLGKCVDGINFIPSSPLIFDCILLYSGLWQPQMSLYHLFFPMRDHL